MGLRVYYNPPSETIQNLPAISLPLPTFKVFLEKIRVECVRLGAVCARVAWVTDTVCPLHTRPVSVTHVLALGANVHTVQGPGRRGGAAGEEALVPTEPDGAGVGGGERKIVAMNQ